MRARLGARLLFLYLAPQAADAVSERRAPDASAHKSEQRVYQVHDSVAEALPTLRRLELQSEYNFMPYPQFSNREAFLSAHNAAIEQAEQDGFSIIQRQPTNLLVDLDCLSLEEFQSRLRLFSLFVPVTNYKYWGSKTPGHYHVVVYLAEPIDTPTAIAYQTMLGSDYKREIISMRGLRYGDEHASVLFKPRDATVITITPSATLFSQENLATSESENE